MLSKGNFKIKTHTSFLQHFESYIYFYIIKKKSLSEIRIFMKKQKYVEVNIQTSIYR